MDTPSAGAIVTPQDKALGMGQDKGKSVVRDDDADRNKSVPNDDERSVNPGPSHDDELSINPGLSNNEESSVNPPPMTGSDEKPADTGGGSMQR